MMKIDTKGQLNGFEQSLTRLSELKPLSSNSGVVVLPLPLSDRLANTYVPPHIHS